MGTIKRVLLLLALVAPLKGSALEAFTSRMGVDMTRYQSGSLYSVGWQGDFDFSRNVLYRVDVGAWTDSKEGHRSSPYASFLLGGRVGSYRSVNATCQVGVLAMGFPDAALSTPFQFTEECAVGYKEISIGYKHVSNAGIKEPNHGRDYIFLQWTLPLTF